MYLQKYFIDADLIFVPFSTTIDFPIINAVCDHNAVSNKILKFNYN